MTKAANITQRVVWTFIAAALGTIPVAAALTGNGSTIAWSTALAAGIAGVLALAKNYLLKPPAFSTNPTLNIIERLAWTAVQAFIGALPVTINLTGHDFKALLYSGLAAALAAVISLAKNLSVEMNPNPGAAISPVIPGLVPPGLGNVASPVLAPLALGGDGKYRPVPANKTNQTMRFDTGSAGSGAKHQAPKPPPKPAARKRSVVQKKAGKKP